MALPIALAIGLPGAVTTAAPAQGNAAPTNIGPAGPCDYYNGIADVGRGSMGPFVLEVQCLLNRAIAPSTHEPISEDSDFGSRTEAKVLRFQECANARGAGLKVDGRVGSKTFPHLQWWAYQPIYIC